MRSDERHALVGDDPELVVQRVAVELVQRQVVVVAQLGHLDVLGDRGRDDDLLDVGAATVLRSRGSASRTPG